MKYVNQNAQSDQRLCKTTEISCFEVTKLEFILRLKIKRKDWLLADTCPQAANHCALFWCHVSTTAKHFQDLDS